VCDLETSRIGAPYIYDISSLRVKTQSNDGQSVNKTTASSNTIVGYVRVTTEFLRMTVPHEVNCMYYIYTI